VYIGDISNGATQMNRNDPDLNHRLYPVETIARSYVASHQMVWNMPPDDELVYALKINGHPATDLDALKAEYVRHARALGIKD
jgi:hypothetical protein